ncbi:MAG: hypothetical protein KAR20_14400, partial [Candidatus Heimdallarchaeota archaeon]|nr:hypothetical protein [Candidatus Heimdallarchaeota archaeon]
MSEIDYCPNCNKLANSYMKKCAYCEGKTIKLHAENAFGTHILVVSLIAFAFFFVFITIGLFDNKLIDIIIGAFLTSFFLFGPIYYLWNKQKPILEALRKRGYQLYLDNKDAYNNEEEIIDPETPPPPTEFPWSIRNFKNLQTALFVSVALIPIPFLIGFFVIKFSNPEDIVKTAMITSVFLMAALVIHMIYTSARRHYGLIQAMHLKPYEISSNLSKLKVRSDTHGDFDLDYDSEHGYRLWIDVNVKSNNTLSEHRVWARPRLISKFKQKQLHVSKSKYQPMGSMQMESIKSLKLIQIENLQFGTKLFAAIEDKAIYSETKDIVKV